MLNVGNPKGRPARRWLRPEPGDLRLVPYLPAVTGLERVEEVAIPEVDPILDHDLQDHAGDQPRPPCGAMPIAAGGLPEPAHGRPAGPSAAWHQPTWTPALEAEGLQATRARLINPTKAGLGWRMTRVGMRSRWERILPLETNCSRKAERPR